MSGYTFTSNYKTNFISDWTKITEVRKPIIAAVNGIAVRKLSKTLIQYHSKFSWEVDVNWQ